MNNCANPLSQIDHMDAAYEAGADLAQAVQDLLDWWGDKPDDTPGKAGFSGHLRRCAAAWEDAYRLGLPSDEELK